MKHLSKLMAGILFMAGNFIVQGQFRAPGGLPAGFDHALLDAFSGEPAFYGTANIQLTNAPGKDPSTISCSIAYLSGDMRVETDSFDPGANVPPTEATQIKQMHAISILRPEKNRMYLLFPQFTSMVELAYDKSTGTAATPAPKISKTPLGKDTIGDQVCQKSQLQVTESDGEQYNITLWESANWNNFPIQMEIGSPPALVQFQDLHLEAPNANQFEVPASYTKYEGIQEIIQRQAEKPTMTNAP